MMFRPRESHDLRLIERSSISCRGPPSFAGCMTFRQFGRRATFSGRTTELRFDSTVTLEHIETELPDYALEPKAATYPFAYPGDDLPDLRLRCSGKLRPTTSIAGRRASSRPAARSTPSRCCAR